MAIHRRTAVFLLAEGLLYAAFLALDLVGGHAPLSDGLKYAAMLLCLVCALTRAAGGGVQGRLQTAALGFTLLADLFLLVLGRWYLAGLISFWVVQGLYIARIRLAGGWKPLTGITLRVLLPAAALMALGTLGLADWVTAAAVVYFSQLLLNAVESGALVGRVPWAGRFQAGLWLFIGCDLCVALHNLTALTGVPLPPWQGRLAAVGMWAFYLPSQVLLTLSIPKEEHP